MNLSRRDFLLSTGALAIPAACARREREADDARHAWTLPERRPVKAIENLWVPMKDGTRIAMRLWLPEGAEQSPVPVVMEYIPYRKRYGTRAGDSAWADAFVPYGFGFARPDIRGSGDSDGVLLGEYLQQEQDDGVEIIACLAKQQIGRAHV